MINFNCVFYRTTFWIFRNYLFLLNERCVYKIYKMYEKFEIKNNMDLPEQNSLFKIMIRRIKIWFSLESNEHNK